MQIEALKANTYRAKKGITSSNNQKTRDEKLNKTLKGVLINNHVQNTTENNVSFNEIQDSLLIVDEPKYYELPQKADNEKNKESSFNVNKAMKPLLIGTGLVLAGSIALSAVLKKSSQLRSNTKFYEQLPDLAVNMNIKEEPQFAIYRAIRDPNFANILGAAAIFIMSGITIASKNFVDGAKEIWLKKQSADIEKNLQENLIEIETNSFSGKLKVVNDMMSKNVKYFDSVLNKKQNTEPKSNIFSDIISFKGSLSQNNETTETKSEDKKEKNIKNLKYAAIIGGVLTGAVIAGKLSFANLRKTAQFTQQYANNYAEQTISAINTIAEKRDPNDIPRITELLQSICAKPEYVKEIGQKYNLQGPDIDKIIGTVEEARKTIFADAPTALGGIPKKIQYYCYIDENRGHLYNWILNPENKFTKYIFMAFTLSSSIGYLFKQGMDAIKEATVMKENAKTELSLRKRLVDVEIQNFKSKKESAIQPLVDNFTKQVNAGIKSVEELKQLADNILTETKNGPPYVYT